MALRPETLLSSASIPSHHEFYQYFQQELTYFFFSLMINTLIVCIYLYQDTIRMNKLILVAATFLLCTLPHNKFTKDIYVESVSNKIQVGNLAGNRNLEFGIRNILEEFLQEKDYDLNPESKSKVSVEVVYLDVLKTKSNLSVFHKNEESVVIRLKGILKVDGKKIKEVIVEEESSEISMSTLAVDNGGQFNQQSLSNAIKKACEKLVDKLFETK